MALMNETLRGKYIMYFKLVLIGITESDIEWPGDPNEWTLEIIIIILTLPDERVGIAERDLERLNDPNKWNLKHVNLMIIFSLLDGRIGAIEPDLERLRDPNKTILEANRINIFSLLDGRMEPDDRVAFGPMKWKGLHVAMLLMANLLDDMIYKTMCYKMKRRWTIMKL